MPIVADGAVRVGADLAPFNRELNRGLGQAEQRAQTFGQKVNAALSPRNLAAGLGVAFGASQVASFFSDAIQAAGEFEDSVSATGVIFGEEAIPALQEWADEAHSAFGSSKQDALAAANQFAVFGKSAGLVGNDLTDFSTKLVQLGGDLASMFGGRTEDAIAAVGSALRGEFEPIRAYGVLLDDATLRQQAFEMGLISTTKNALTPQQRVLAAQASIFAQTSDAQGDFARTSDGLMNTQRDLAAELENVSIEVGEKLLPIMLELVTFVRNTGIPVMREFLGLLDFESQDSAEGIPILGDIEAALNTAVDSSFVFRDMLLMQENAVGQAAKAMGTDYMTMHWRIKAVMDEMGVDHQTAVDTILGGLRALPADAAWAQLGQRQTEAADAWNSLGQSAAELPVTLQEVQDEAAEIARQTPGALASSLRAGIEDYDAALEELTVEAENSVSDLAERQKIEGILASTQLTEALTSDSTRTRLNAIALVEDLVADYELLGPGAYAAGELVDPSMASGMDANLGLAVDAAEGIVDAAGNPLVELDASEGGVSLIESWIAGMQRGWDQGVNNVYAITNRAGRILGLSLPTEGPLAGGIASGGYSVIESWFSDMDKAAREGMGTLTGIAGAAGMALNPAASGLGSLPLGSVAGAAGAGITYQLVVNGVPRAFNSRTDFMNALDDLGSFGDGRL